MGTPQWIRSQQAARVAEANAATTVAGKRNPDPERLRKAVNRWGWGSPQVERLMKELKRG
jgi:hypothetical protein